MRILNWNPNAMDQTFEDVAMGRIVAACHVVKDRSVRNLRSTIGLGWGKHKAKGDEFMTKGVQSPISRPAYRGGPKWTAREFGTMLKSARVVQKKTKTGKPLQRRRDVRVIIGTYMAWYALIYEFYHPYMRTALDQSIPAMKNIIGVR